MNKIDYIRKTVYLIAGILTIISLVFTICKKVGFCAGSSSSFPMKPDVSKYPESLCYGNDFNDFLDFITEDIGSLPSIANNYKRFIIYYTLDQGSPYFRVVCFPNTGFYVYNSNSSSISFNTLISNYDNGQSVQFGNNSSVYMFYYRVSSNGFSRSSYSNFGTWTCSKSQVIFYSSDDFYMYNSGTDFGKYVFLKSDIPLDVPSGHTKGGVLLNLEDSFETIEDFDGPGVDTSSPSDPSSVPAWLGKILNGIGSLNKSILSGVLTLGDYIGAGIEKLLDKLNELKDLVTGIYNWFTEDFDSNQFQSDLYSIPLISDLMGLTSLVENSGMFDWSDVTPAQTVSFTFDFGGAVLPHSTNTIDFSWYTGNVRFICNALLCTFLVLGLFVTIINQIPSIIGGHSGDKGGGSDS